VKKLIIVLAALLCCFAANAADGDAVNREIYGKVAASVTDKAALPVSELTVQVALSLLGTPYVGGSIEGENEELRIFLDKTDCILFVETCICMALSFKGIEIVQGGPSADVEPSYELFCDNVRNMRYRGGEVNGYASRLHYTSEWILQAQANGVMKEYSREIGVPREQRFSFMTSHADLYPVLKDNPSQIALVKAAERSLEDAGPYYYVPQTVLKDASASDKVKSGDIIFIVSGAEGLDISHVAIAYENEGAMHFIHASSKAGKVIIEPRTLAEYASRGIRAARLCDQSSLRTAIKAL